MRRIVFIAVMLFLFAIPAAAQTIRVTPFPTAQTYTVGSNNVRARACPQTNCEIEFVYQSGNRVQVIGTTAGASVNGNTTWLVIEDTRFDDPLYMHSSLARRGSSGASNTGSLGNGSNSAGSSNSTGSQPISTPIPPAAPVSTPVPPPAAFVCNCNLTCGQMATCEEAYYQLTNCGCGRRDGDGDGVPCEEMCPGG